MERQKGCQVWSAQRGYLMHRLPSKIKPLDAFVVVVVVCCSFQIISGWSTCEHWCAHVNSPSGFEWAPPCGRYWLHSGGKLSKNFLPCWLKPCAFVFFSFFFLLFLTPREWTQHIVRWRLVVRLFPDHMANVHLAKWFWRANRCEKLVPALTCTWLGSFENKYINNVSLCVFFYFSRKSFGFIHA